LGFFKGEVMKVTDTMAIAATSLPKPTRFNDGSEFNAIAIEVDQLSALGVADITSVGAENIYVLKDGLHYYCKVMATERFEQGLWDFEKNRSAAPIHTLLADVPESVLLGEQRANNH
jgi:hypothetical protein